MTTADVHASKRQSALLILQPSIRNIHTVSYGYCKTAVWFSGDALVSINVVALRRARLVLGWVTVRE